MSPVDHETLVERARNRLTGVLDELVDSRDPAAIRDLSIGLAALGEAVEKLEDLSDRERVHRAVLRRWAKDLNAMLRPLVGAQDDDEPILRYGSYAGDFDRVKVIDERGKVLGEITSRQFWPVVEGVLKEIADLAGEEGPR